MMNQPLSSIRYQTSMTLQLTTLSLCAMLLLLVPACGVLTIDVDVYKGPLTHHKSLQAEYAAGTAIAAKPLLARLRYQLERYNPRHGEYAINDEDLPGELRGLEYFQEHDPDYRFESSQASVVNDLLAQFNTTDEVAELRVAMQEQRAPKLVALDPNDIYAAVASAARDRKTEGIETLTHRYKEAYRVYETGEGVYLKENSPELLEIKRAQAELEDALVTFAHKILVLANHEVLLQETPGIVNSWKWTTSKVINGGPVDIVSAQSYVQVLQAIGNTILAQIDALRTETDHQRRAVAGYSRELAYANLPDDAEVPPAIEFIFRRAKDYRDIDSWSQIKKLENQMQLKDDAMRTAKVSLDEARLLGEQADVAESRQRQLSSLDKELKKKTATDKYEMKRLQDDFTAQEKLVPTNPDLDDDVKKAARVAELQGAIAALDLLQPEVGWTIGDARASTNSLLTSAKEAAIVAREQAPSEQALTKLNSELTMIQQECDRLQNSLAERIDIERNAYTRSIEMMSDLYPQLKNWLKKEGREANAARFRIFFHEQIDQTSGENDDAIRREAMDLLKGIPEVPEFMMQGVSESLVAVTPAKLGTQPTVKDVLETLHAKIRHDIVRAVATEGEESTHVAKLRATLAEVERQRAEMTHIRPAWAFLRTSFAVTALQPDAKLGWRNMLGEQAVKQIPFASEMFFQNQNLRALVELDKQYWQNVNTIRVAGGGITNYVVVKDDVGNWYVKNYSADPKPIIQSAKNLALFGIAPGLSPDLYGMIAQQIEEEAKNEKKLKTPGPGEAAEATPGVGPGATAASENEPVEGDEAGKKKAPADQKTPKPKVPVAAGVAANRPLTTLEKQLVHARKTYDTATASAAGEAAKGAAGIGDAVKAKWQAAEAIKALGEAEVKKLTDAVDEAAKDLKPATSAAQAPPAAGKSVDESTTLAGLEAQANAILAFHKQLHAKVGELTTPASDASAETQAKLAAARLAAHQVLTNAVQSTVEGVIRKQRAAMERYDLTLGIIGGMSSDPLVQQRTGATP